jgi:hypothetical protein
LSSPPRRACGVCGAPAPAPFRAPQPEIAPDLDMRPGEPARSTLPNWICTCRSCQAAAPDLGRLPDGAAAVVRGAAYAALVEGMPRAVVPFLRWALICRETGDPAGEAEALLQGAWAADDEPALDVARDLRLRVAALWDGVATADTRLRRLDVLRRAGALAAARALASDLAALPLDETARSVLRFQAARIEAGDSGRHLISSALPPPAVAPHVTHVRQQKPGLLGRLFGRG